ncbi:MAG: chromosome segregation protein SMC [Candidatus Aminicenantaceae bacterium]
MLIKKLELQGFKSFPERAKLIFHPGITIIVGPNGTGKSNIVDAIIWVLGGQRLKSLRGERSEDLIFNGNTNKAPLGMADVSLFFKEEDDELSVNHRIFRSGESEYRLNGKLARLKDIQEELWKRSIGEKEYFVIEQGSVGLFLNSKPTEKRVLLEEAAGTSYYRDKKRQTQNKLKNSEQNLIRLVDIIYEVKKEKNSLRRQAKAAEKYRKTREKIRTLTECHFRARIEKMEKSQTESSENYEKALNEEKSVISQLKTLEKKATEKRKQLWELEKSTKQGNEKLFSIRSQLSRLESDNDRRMKRSELLEERKEKSSKEILEYKQEYQLLDKEEQEAEQNLANLSLEVGEKQEKIKKTEEAVQESVEKLKTKEKQLESIREEYFQKISGHTEVNNEKAKIDKEIELLSKQKERLKKELEEEKNLLEQKNQKLQNSEQEIEKFLGLKKELLGKIESNQEKIREINQSLEDLQNQMSEIQKQKDQNDHHLEALKKLEEKERETESSEKIPGAMGILADHIKADPEYAPIIDIFWKEEAKATLIHRKDIHRLIEENKIKGNFFLLDKNKKGKFPQDLYKDSRVSGFLKSSVQPEKDIQEYLSGLDDAVIVKDIKTALDLWKDFPSANFVTYRGDLLLSTGLLKLGKKREGIFTLSQEIQRVEKATHEADQKINPLKQSFEEISAEKTKLEANSEELSSSVSQLEKKIESIKNEMIYDQAEKEKTNTNISIFENELRTLEKDMKEMGEKSKSLRSKTDSFEEEKRLIKEKMNQFEGEISEQQKINEQSRNHYFELKSGADILNEKIKNIKNQVESFQTRKQNISLKLNNLESEIRSIDQEKVQLKEEIRKISVEIEHLGEEKKKKEANLSICEAKLNDLRREEKEMEKSVDDLRSEYEQKKEERVKWEIKKAESDRDLVNLEESCWQELKKSLEEVKNDVPEDEKALTEADKKLEAAKQDLQKISNVNLMAEEEFQAKKKRYDFLIQQKEDLENSIQSTKEAIHKIDEESKSQFLKALKEVNNHFQEVFSLLFKGGKAGIELTDDSNPLDCGVEIYAQPPGKKVKSLSLLSGGEKSLTSLAFFFALFRYKPTPFCILDEVDAALDETNLSRFLELMKKIKHQTQFIIITHNFKTMEVADYIYGTTMEEPNLTKIYSMKLDKKK